MRHTIAASLPLCLPLAVLLACHSDTLTEPASGTLRLEATVTGDDQDPDGFTVQIDSGPATPVVAGGVLLQSVAAGDYRVTLGGVAANCAVAEGNPRTITVNAADTTVVTFAVACAATTGSLRLTVVTTGPASDPDGFLVNLDGRSLVRILGDTTLRQLPPGMHSLALGDVAPTCELAGSAPRPIDVVAGGTDSVDFAVACVEPPRITFTKVASGVSGLFVMNHDGTDRREIYSGLAFGPRWSPDHHRIAFATPAAELFAVSADGSGLVKLTALSLPPAQVSLSAIVWSPDGSTVAFQLDVGNAEGSLDVSQIWLAASDGSGAHQLATGAMPAWSPDGHAIAFLAPEEGQLEVWTVRPDGGGLTRVTHLRSDIVSRPLWSPDGSRILFQEQVTIRPEISPAEVMVVPAEGGQATSVTPGMWGWEPTWAAHGDSIEYLADGNLTTIVSVDGSGRHLVGDLSALARGPHDPLSVRWSANGREAILARINNGYQIYTVDADGTHARNLSDDPAIWEMDPDW